ncbi:MAG: alpha/beta hydrolase [Gammaproteobacteria bacterium]|nr:alpha/beta hydrolase [Gammaproteobacteria bacterium]
MDRKQIIETAPGIRLSVGVAGSGPLVILMHGWPELGLSWRHQVEPLVAAGYTVAVPDMRGYGESSQPRDITAYHLDALADDMAAVAHALGASRWVSVGHDWGAPVAWRTALRFPEAVAGVFALSVPYIPAPPPEHDEGFREAFPDRFFYIRYFQEVGGPEAELEKDPRAALKKMFFALSGDAPKDEWVKMRPRDTKLLPDLVEPPPEPLSFMSDEELDRYADQYHKSGFFGSLSWYRNSRKNAEAGRSYGDQRIRQPTGFLCGDKEIVLTMVPTALEMQRQLCDDLRQEIILPGSGHWIQQERPDEVSEALIGFLGSIRI